MMKQPGPAPAPAMGIPVGQSYATAPHPPPPPPPATEDFSTGLCDCFSDCSLCCLTCWCPCITFGRIAEIVDKGSSSCGVSGALYALIMGLSGCQWIYSFAYRSKLKAQFGIMDQSSYKDCCIHFWCEPCALCQEYRELEHRGYNLALGWQGNMEGQNAGLVPPQGPGGMTR